jgi:hypothetical protein
VFSHMNMGVLGGFYYRNACVGVKMFFFLVFLIGKWVFLMGKWVFLGDFTKEMDVFAVLI